MQTIKILNSFDKYEYEKLLKVDWQKALKEAKPLCKRIHGCETCQKPTIPYVFELKYSYSGRKVNYKYLAFFCSVECFQQWRASGKELYKLYDGKEVYKKLLGQLAGHYSVQELVKFHDFDFHQAVKNEISNYEKNHFCDYCHKNEKTNYSFLLMGKKRKTTPSSTFCSKKCMMKDFQRVLHYETF